MLYQLSHVRMFTRAGIAVPVPLTLAESWTSLCTTAAYRSGDHISVRADHSSGNTS
jgi:hypothetical protein